MGPQAKVYMYVCSVLLGDWPYAQYEHIEYIYCWETGPMLNMSILNICIVGRLALCILNIYIVGRLALFSI